MKTFTSDGDFGYTAAESRTAGLIQGAVGGVRTLSAKGRTKVEKRRESIGSDYAKGMSQASEGLATALSFVGVVLLFWLGGRGLDGWLDTEPWFQLVGAVVGWVLGTLSVIFSVKYRSQSEGSESSK